MTSTARFDNWQNRLGTQAGSIDASGNVTFDNDVTVSGDATVSGELTVDTSTLHVDSTNNRVGIGTTTPNRVLDVNNAANSYIGFSENGDEAWVLGYEGSPNRFIVYGGTPSGTRDYRVVIDDSGNVGIGTTSPTAKLDIQGNSNDLWTTNSWKDSVRIDNGGILRWAIGSTTVHGIGQAGDNLYFGRSTTEDASSAATSYTMMLDSSGNVGIGTTAPDFDLDVRGQAIIGGGDNRTPDADSDGHLMIRGSGYRGFATLDGNAMWVGHNSALRDLHLATDETARMTIDRSGRVTAPYQPFVQAKSPGGGYVTPASSSLWTELNSSYWGSNWVTSQNIGSHFNTSTARLTAPVSGVYFMTWTGYFDNPAGGSGSYIHPTIFINGSYTWNNGQQPYVIYGYSYDGLQNGVSVSYTFYLSAGDYVAPGCYFRSTNDRFHGSYSYLSAGLLH